MVTKTKTAGSAHAASDKDPGRMFAEALELVHRKDHVKAVAALNEVRNVASEQGLTGLVRSAENYVKALQAHTQRTEEGGAAPALAAQVALNRGDADAALALVDGALASQGPDAALFYLKATAHAQKEEAEAAAEALRKATALNPDFLPQSRLERDFDRVRSSAPFASLGLG